MFSGKLYYRFEQQMDGVGNRVFENTKSGNLLESESFMWTDTSSSSVLLMDAMLQFGPCIPAIEQGLT